MKKADLLPKEFKFSHNFAWYLHDCLADNIIFGEKSKLFSVKISLDNENQAKEFSNLVGVEILRWLEKHNKSSELGELLLKSVYPAILADYCQFVSEALHCSEKGKLTVTYALLRKPLRDNLLYFEWLLADPNNLLNTLYNMPPSELELNKLISEDKAIPRIQAAINRTSSSNILDAEFIYNSRYNRSLESSFEQLWNKALHLITTRKHIETEERSFNFIFTDDEGRWSQWYHIYTTLPYLLYYTVEIADSLMVLIMQEIPPNFNEAILHRSIGLLLWGQEISKISNQNSDDINFEDVFNDEKFTCVHCKNIMYIHYRNCLQLFEKHFIRCNHCQRKNSISDLANDRKFGFNS